MRKGLLAVVVVTAAWLIAVSTSSATLFDGDTAALSRTSGDSGPTANDMSEGGSLSDDGRIAVFSSRATNLGAPSNRVFLRDLITGEMRVVSKRGELTFRGDEPILSGDGRYVAFVSNSTDVVDGIGDGNVRFAFRIKLDDGSIDLVSREDGPDGTPIPVPDISGSDIHISDDGSRVGFSARSAGTMQTYVRDLDSGSLHLVSSPTGSGDEADDDAEIQDMSDNGQFVLFNSQATNLNDEASGLTVDSYVHDISAETTTWLKQSTPSHCANPKFLHLSSTGRFATFNCREDGSTLAAYKFDFATSSVTQIARQSFQEFSAGLISDDGRNVVFSGSGPAMGVPGASPDHSQVFLRDTGTGSNTLVSRATGVNGAPASDSAFSQAITPDATLVVFTSGAQNLGVTTAPTASSSTPSQVFLRRVAGNPRPPAPPKPAPPVSPDAQFVIGFPKRVRPGRAIGLAVRCKRPDACVLDIEASVSGKRVRIRPLKFMKSVKPGSSVLRISLTSGVTKKVRAALKRRTKLKLKLVVSSSDKQTVQQRQVPLK